MTSSLSSEYLDHDKEKRAKLSGKVQQIRWGAAVQFRSAQFEMLITHSEMPGGSWKEEDVVQETKIN